MKAPNLRGLFGCLAALALFSAISTHAALYARDNAGNYTGWGTGANQGTGFGAWTMTSDSTSGWYLGSSTALTGGSAPNIDSAGKSFALWGHSGQYATARRGFADGATMGLGDSFSFVIAVNYRNGAKGFDLLDSSGNTIWNFNVSGDKYNVNYGGATSLFGNEYDENTVFTWTFTQTANNTLSWEVDRTGGLTGTASGTANIDAGTFSSIRFYVGATDGSAAANNLFFNDLSAVPEPAHYGLICAAGLMGVAAFRARRAKATR